MISTYGSLVTNHTTLAAEKIIMKLHEVLFRGPSPFPSVFLAHVFRVYPLLLEEVVVIPKGFFDGSADPTINRATQAGGKELSNSCKSYTAPFRDALDYVQQRLF